MSLLVKTTFAVRINDPEVAAEREKAMGKMFFKARTDGGAQKCQGPGFEKDKGCERIVAANKLYCWTCYSVLVDRWHAEQKGIAERAESNVVVHSGADGDCDGRSAALGA